MCSQSGRGLEVLAASGERVESEEGEREEGEGVESEERVRRVRE